VFRVAFSPDSRTVAATGPFTQTRLWDTRTGKALPRLGHRKHCYGDVAFSPDGRMLAMRHGGTVELWDCTTGREVRRLGEPKAFSVSSQLVFSPDGATLAGFAADRHWILLCDVVTGKEKAITPGHRSPVVRTVPSPNGKRVATAAQDGTICLWDTATGRELVRCAGRKEQVRDLLFTPDGKTLISGGPGGDEEPLKYTVRLWDAATGKERAFLTTLETQTGTIALSGDGKTLAIGNEDGVKLWDLSKRPPSLSLTAVKQDSRIALSPDGKTLATVTGQVSGKMVGPRPKRRWSGPELATITLWDLDTGKAKGTLAHNSSGVHSLAFTPDGTMLAAGCGDEKLRLWDVATQRLQHEIKLPPPWSILEIAFSCDGKLMVTREGFGIKQAGVAVRETITGQKIAGIEGHDGNVSSIAFIPGRWLLVTGSADCTALIWDLARLPELAVTAGSVTEKECQRLWVGLREQEASQAYRAIFRLSKCPDKTVAMLRKHLQPFPKRDLKRIEALVRQLDSDSRLERDRATRELEDLGQLATPELEKVLKTAHSPEMKRRARGLLESQPRGPASPGRLQQVRAIQLLEWIGSAEARGLLQKLAGGEPLALITQDARKAIKRLEHAGKKP
jgi:WD40 repeat protein